MAKVIGIYKITSGENTLYVGQSRDVSHRISTHKSSLRYNKHPNILLQRMKNKGYEMVFSVVESDVPIEDLNKREMHFIDKLKPLCNIAVPSENDSWTFTEDRNKRVSIGNKGKKKSKAHRLRISTGRKEAIKNEPEKFAYLQNPWNKGVGDYMLGDKNHFYGKKHSEETKRLLSKKNKKYNIDIDRVVELRKLGYTFEKISNEFGCSRGLIGKIYNKYETGNWGSCPFKKK